MSALRKKSLCMLAGVIAANLVAACVPTTPQWDAQFGQSVRQAQLQQTINPNTGRDVEVNGIDGASGREAVIRYRNSFKDPSPVNPSFTIGVSR
jgi:hypothetical protein